MSSSFRTALAIAALLGVAAIFGDYRGFLKFSVGAEGINLQIGPDQKR
jgi:hypothetical protein